MSIPVNGRGCYCGVPAKGGEGDTRQSPPGFCGTCEVCGASGHVRHFPGAVPYTGSWCDAHYRRLKFTHPMSPWGCLTWLGIFVVVGVAIRTFRPVPSIPCADVVGDAVIVDTSRRGLVLCEGGADVGRYGVRTGSHGVGKSREGDRKTPLGVYSLGVPRPSSDFGTFVAIGYPTEEQRRKGFTGSAVGLHGPRREVRFLGPFVNLFDSTDGCVGLATDEAMDRVASWISRRGVRRIDLR
ncbi:MAG: L,D-transpeptidase family protein [Polyangiaceae bacterium]